MLGVVFAGGGSVATFVTDNQVGTGALLIVGTLFLIAAVSGRFPSKLQLGESSIEYTENVLEVVAEKASPEVAEEVIGDVVDNGPLELRPMAESLLNRIQNERDLENIVAVGVSDAFSQRVDDTLRKEGVRPAMLLHRNYRQGGREYDFVIEGDKSLSIEVAGTPGKVLTVERAGAVIERIIEGGRPGLLITAANLTSAARHKLQESGIEILQLGKDGEVNEIRSSVVERVLQMIR